MKNLILIMALFFLSTAVYSQGKKDKMKMDHEAKAMVYADKMVSRLGLTPDQKIKIKEAQMKRLEAQQDLMDEYADNKEADPEDKAEMKAKMHEKKMKIQADFKEDMKEILSEAQYSQWEIIHARKMKMKGKKDNIEDDGTGEKVGQ